MHIEPPANLKKFHIWEYTSVIFMTKRRALLLLSAVSILPRVIYHLILVLPFGISVTKITNSLIDLFLSIWAVIRIVGIMLITENSLHNRTHLTFKQAFKYGFSRWGAVIGTFLILGLEILFAGSLLAFPLYFVKQFTVVHSLIIAIISITVTVYLQFILQNVALRPNPKLSPIKRSWQIVKGQWWYTFGHSLACYIPLALISFGFSALLRITISDLRLVRILAQDILSWLILPISYIYLTLLFLMLEARKEALAPEDSLPA